MPTDWTSSFDGASVSLRPSIGNWSYSCESHYFITKNKVRWVPKMSRSEIEKGRDRDRRAKNLESGTDKRHSSCHSPAEIRMSNDAEAENQLSDFSEFLDEKSLNYSCT